MVLLEQFIKFIPPSFFQHYHLIPGILIPGTNLLQVLKSTNPPPLSCLSLMAYSKRSNVLLRIKRPMHRNKSKHQLLLNRPLVIAASLTATITNVKVTVPKEQQRSMKKKLRGKKKGKEKAHNTTDGGGGDLGSKDEGSHLVKFKKCLTTNINNFSSYSLFDGNSLSSPNNPEVQAYRTRSATNSPTIIIDSGTTSHIQQISSC
jgi:hypothetical protein